jgi:hypothetical protein
MNGTRRNFDSQWVRDVAHVSHPVAAQAILADAELARDVTERLL